MSSEKNTTFIGEYREPVQVKEAEPINWNLFPAGQSTGVELKGDGRVVQDRGQ